MPDLNLNKKIAIIVIGVVLTFIVSTVLFQIAVNHMPPSAKPQSISSEEQKKIRPAAEQPADDAVIKSSEAVIAENPEAPKAEDAYRRLAAIYEKRQNLVKLKEKHGAILVVDDAHATGTLSPRGCSTG